jgi:hypothetical protein
MAGAVPTALAVRRVTSRLGVDLVDHSHDSGLHLALELLQADGLSKLEKFRSAPPCDKVMGRLVSTVLALATAAGAV